MPSKGILKHSVKEHFIKNTTEIDNQAETI